MDGIKMIVKSLPFPEWSKKVGIQFSVEVNLETGELSGRRHRGKPNDITYRHVAMWRGYRLKVLEMHYSGANAPRIVFNLIIEGSLHKSFGGGKNDSRFTLQNLRSEIQHLCTALSLKMEDVVLQRLEFGVNLNGFPDERIVSDGWAMLHMTKPFVPYRPDSKGLVIGSVAHHFQYAIKLYSKSLQYGLPDPLIRFEIKFAKMQILAKRGIKTLADLIDPAKFDALSELLLSAWGNLLFCDPTIDPSELPISRQDQELLRDGCNRDYWLRLHANNRSSFHKKRSRFRKLISKYSKLNIQEYGHSLIVNELAAIRGEGSILPCAEVGHCNADKKDFTTWIKSDSNPIQSEDQSTSLPQEGFNKSTPNIVIRNLQIDQPNHPIADQSEQVTDRPIVLKNVEEHETPAAPTQRMSILDIIKGILFNDTAVILAMQNKLSRLITSFVMRWAK